MSLTTSCAHCGTHPSTERPAFTWSFAVQRGHRTWTCGPCARAHLHQIESGLSLVDH